MIKSRAAFFLFSLFALAFTLLNESAQAQRRREDVLYLKNGSILRGKILEMDADTIMIEIVGRNIFVFPRSEARGITQEKRTIAYKESGYMFVLETGLLTGRTPRNNNFGPNQSITSFTLHCVNGYELRPEFALGIGVGVDGYQNASVVPLYLRATGSVFKLTEQISPLYIVDVGYGFYSHIFNGSNGGNGGLMVNPALGLRIRLGSSSSFIMNAGYRIQKLQTNSFFGSPGDGIQEKFTYKRMSVRAGFMF